LLSYFQVVADGNSPVIAASQRLALQNREDRLFNGYERLFHENEVTVPLAVALKDEQRLLIPCRVFDESELGKVMAALVNVLLQLVELVT
jgi:hypothetical protein